MKPACSSDLDRLTAQLHARRSRMAEGSKLNELCRSRSLSELGRNVLPRREEFTRTTEFQRQLIRDLIQELSGCCSHLDGASRPFIRWLQTRFQVENVKVFLRGILNRTPPDELRPHLVDLPAELALDFAGLTGEMTLPAFITHLPAGPPRKFLENFVSRQNDSPSGFLLEAALDAGYFEELLRLAGRLPGDEREILEPSVTQEINMFQFLLVARGKFHFGLSPEVLSPLRVTRGEWLHRLQSAPDILTAAQIADGVVIDELPAQLRSGDGQPAPDLATIERLAWQRYLRLANRAFRRSHLGIAAVAGYFGVRRIEIANLITLSEGIRLGVTAEKIRARLVPQTVVEVAHV